MNIINLEKQTANEKQFRFLLIVLLSVIVLSSIIIIISFFLRKKRTKQLHETEKVLMETELEKNQVEQQKLSEDIEFKTKQLTTYVLSIMQKIKLLQEVNSGIDEVLKNPDDLNDSFRKLKRQINKSIKVDDDLSEFIQGVK